jgi:hypothetical protein
MFLRFVGSEINEDSKTQKGIFNLAYELVESGLLNKSEDVYLKELLDWFGKNLPVPDKLNNSNFVTSLFLCWFKDSAIEMLDRVWDLKQILENHDILIFVIKSNDIGHIIFNDEFQALARPIKKEYNKIGRR